MPGKFRLFADKHAPAADDDEPAVPIRPLPHPYAARDVKLRLFLMLAALFGVLTAIDVARKPDNWNWLKREDNAEAEQPPNSKLPPRAAPASSDPGSFVSRLDEPAQEEPEPEHALPVDPLARAWRQGWRELFRALPAQDRGAVYRGLKGLRDQAALSTEHLQQLTDAVARLEQGWKTYQAQAANSVASLNEDERPAYLKLLGDMNARWTTATLPALTALAEGRTPAADEKRELADLQRLLDDIELHAIRDDTVWRPSEREIWFRLFEQVQDRSPEELAREEPALVGYAQLFKQSSDYRGQLVTTRGTARQAYHVQAPENWCGIEGYYVFVLRPADGANSPVIIYTLETPPGFPPIKDKDLDKATTSLDEEMEFTGYFFKRWAYLGRDGVYTAPLLLARSGKWIERPRIGAGVVFPSGWRLAGWVGGIAGVTMLLSALLFWQLGRRGAAASLPADDVVRERLSTLAEKDLAPSLSDRLRQMGEEQA